MCKQRAYDIFSSPASICCTNYPCIWIVGHAGCSLCSPFLRLSLPFNKCPTLEIFLACSHDSGSESRTAQDLLDTLKRIHDGFTPYFKHFTHETPYGLLCLRACGIVRYTRARGARTAFRRCSRIGRDGCVGCERWVCGGASSRVLWRLVGQVREMQNHEAGGGGSQEGGDVTAGKVVDAL